MFGGVPFISPELSPIYLPAPQQDYLTLLFHFPAPDSTRPSEEVTQPQTSMNQRFLLSLFALLFCSFLSAQNGVLAEIAALNVSPAFEVALYGDHLYVNPGFSNIQIFDLSDPANPQSLSSVGYGGNYANRIDAEGDFLFLTGGPDNTFRIFDLTDPAIPNALGTAPIPVAGVQHVVHSTDFSYISAGQNLYVVDHADKNKPFLSDSIVLPTPGPYGLRELAIHQGALYIATETGFHILDLSNPALPSFVQSINGAAFTLALDTAQDRLYTGQPFPSNGHYAYDISNPLAPLPLLAGSGGTSTSQDMSFSQGIVLQTGPDILPSQTVNAFRVANGTSTWLEEFDGSKDFAVTEIISRDSLFIVAKFGGIEILTVSELVSNEGPIEAIGLDLWPNPTRGQLRVRIDASLGAPTLLVRDLTGRTLRRIEMDGIEGEMDLGELSAGVYLVSVIGDGGILATRRICIE